MRLVMNKKFGGFRLPQEFITMYNRDGVHDFNDEDRENQDLINIVESDNYHGDLQVVEIPDDYTDIEWDEYDGIEIIRYVRNGKIHRA